MLAGALARMPDPFVERPLALGTVIAMRESHRARLHEAVVRALLREKALRGLTEEALAVRLGKTTEEIDSFFLSPDGWTLETMIDVLTAANLRIDAVQIGR